MTIPTFHDRDVIEAMREWALDCEWQDRDNIAEMLPGEIVFGVERHFDGGVEAFLATMEGADNA